MYKNVGRKIRICAQIMGWLGTAASMICGIWLIAQGMTLDTYRLGMELRNMIWEVTRSSISIDGGIIAAALIVLGILVMIMGPLSVWTGACMSCGFGEMIEDSGARLAAQKRSYR